MAINTFQDLEVWSVAMDLAEECFKATQPFPREELFGLTSQIRRAANSIPANIAEGQGREHTKEFIHFLGIAKGSLNELETHILLSRRVGFLKDVQVSTLRDLITRVGSMIVKLRLALRKRLGDREA